jgi:predicted nucleic acid-binding protein
VGLLIDSTVLIRAERRQSTPARLLADLSDEFGDEEVAISVMSAGELFHGCWRTDGAVRRARRTDFVESILTAIPAIPLTLPILRVFGEIDAHLSSRGKRIPTSDLLIACTALTRGDRIVTGDARHYDRVPGLVVRRW